MADDNKIQFDLELNETSVKESFQVVDKEAKVHADEMSNIFKSVVKKHEEDRIESENKIAAKRIQEARDFQRETERLQKESLQRQNEIYKASVKRNLDDAIRAITRSDSIKKSAADSASVFEEAFAAEAKKFAPIDIPEPRGLESLGSFSKIAGAIGVAAAALTALKKVTGELIDLAVSGTEKIKLDKRFEALAAQAGIAADVIGNELRASVQGLVDDDELLRVGSEAFVQLGNNAKALPQILDLARKTYAVFGGSIVANTEAINHAIFTGQTRQIKHFGLMVNTEQVYRDYARQLGTVVPLLTEQQKQTAILNAVLEQGRTQFQNVVVDTNNAKDGLTIMKNSVKELGDEIAKLVAHKTGGFFSSIFQSIGDSARDLADKLKNARPAETIQDITERLETLKQKVSEYNSQLESLGTGKESAFGAILEGNIEIAQKRIEEYTNKLNILKAKQEEIMKAGANAAPVANNVSDEFLRRRQELVLKVQELNNQVRASDVQLAQEEFNANKTRANLEMLNYQQRAQAAQQYQQAKAQQEKFFADNGINDENLRNQAREALEADFLNRMLLLQKNYQAQRKQIFDEGHTQAISAAEGFKYMLEGLQAAAEEMSVNAAMNFKNLGKAMLTSVGQASANAFAAFGNAIAKGEDALDAFGKSLLNSLGQMAIQMGSTFILQGIAYSYAGLANGPPLIAAGAALAAIGGVLAASGGAGPKDVSGGGISGNTTGSEANTITEAPNPEDIASQGPNTSVNLTINGNILDRRQTGLEIAEILQEQFAEQGLVVRGA